MKETYYVVQDKNSEAFYCVLPNRGFVVWSTELFKAFLFSTEAEAEKVRLGRYPPEVSLIVLRVSMVVESL